MMLFCGDPHGDFDQILLAAELHPGASVILLGDMEPNRPLSIELEPILERVWWIQGNHDTASSFSTARLATLGWPIAALMAVS